MGEWEGDFGEGGHRLPAPAGGFWEAHTALQLSACAWPAVLCVQAARAAQRGGWARCPWFGEEGLIVDSQALEDGTSCPHQSL